MDQTARAVFFLPADTGTPSYSKPLMLEAVLFCPILAWASETLQAEGVGRFFAVCDEAWADEARSCFPAGAEVTVSSRREDLLAFLAGEGPVTVFPRPAVPSPGAGAGYIYAADAAALRTAWQSTAATNMQEGESVNGWVALCSRRDIEEAQTFLRRRIVVRHRDAGVSFLDPESAYLDPRAEIGAGTLILPGTILRGRTKIGRNCVIGPNAMVRDCEIGDETEINASQLNESTVGQRTHVGPFAYVRPGSHIGSDAKVGDFVEVKNSTVGNGTKISHLTYVGDSDVGQRVNFGCGTVTTNYDGFKKSRCTIGDDAFIGCNTNLVAPVSLGEGAYTAAGTTVTQDVPADALAVGRARQENKTGWAARNRKIHGKERKSK